LGLNEIIRIGDVIKKYRKEILNITQDEMAIKLGIPRSTYGNYENNSREPSSELLERIAAALGVSIFDLISGSKEYVSLEGDYDKEGNFNLDLIDPSIKNTYKHLVESGYKVDRKKGDEGCFIITRDGVLIANLNFSNLSDLGKIISKEFSKFIKLIISEYLLNSFVDSKIEKIEEDIESANSINRVLSDPHITVED
jgi:transcriptional regulator with XRE-family HTH domain